MLQRLKHPVTPDQSPILTLSRLVSGREHLFLALAIWSLVAALEVAFWASLAPVVLLGCLNGLLLMLMLHPLLQRALALPGAWAFVIVPALTLTAMVLQSAIDLAIVSKLGDLIYPDASRMTDFTFPRTPQELAFQFGINLRLNFWYFSFFSLAVTLLHTQRFALEARLQAKTAELEVVQLQLAPHFLFNALNSLNALVASGRTGEAEDMIHRLSDFFRTVLRADAPDQRPLGDEIANTEGYLEIEQVRFGSRLEVHIDAPETLKDAIVPAMILQPLTENVVRHAVGRSSEKVSLHILARQANDMLEICVHNTLPRALDAEVPGMGLGHRNLRRRLAALRGAELDAAPVEDGYRALIRLPLARAA